MRLVSTLMVVAHSILIMAYPMTKKAKSYQELGGDYFDRINKSQLQNPLIRRLQQLGVAVTVQPDVWRNFRRSHYFFCTSEWTLHKNCDIVLCAESEAHVALGRGTIVGSYEIVSLIGEGGMGQVYRGRDAKLGREVAVKALPESFVHDTERVARFDREAQLLAALNHPNIAAIYDVTQSGGAKYLILELVEGETLSERLDRGPLSLEETLDFALQIAEALGAAHEKNIIHRDLKPSNIKVTPDGRVKVLDFGLAKARDGAPSSSVVASNSPTLSVIQSAAGVIMGTAAYMSPEQARGRAVDKRCDVWAFGCVVFEMLTGQMTFPNGETVSDTIAGILAREPDWNHLPASTPRRLRSLLQRCLRKDLRQRMQDIGDARIELEEISREPATQEIAVSVSSPRRRREVLVASIAALFFLSTTVFFAVRSERGTDSATVSVVQFEVSPPAGSTFRANNLLFGSKAPFPELSPDGRKLAFVASTETKQSLWIRPLDTPSFTSLPDTDNATLPFWSPDGAGIAFFSQDKLKKISVGGGTSQILCDLPTAQAGGGTWNSEGVILLGRDNGSLQRLSATGGQPVPETELDATRKETGHVAPHFFPDGRRYTFIAHPGNPLQGQTFVGTLGSKQRKALPNIQSEAIYSPAGYLLFIRAGTLMAQRFDVSRFELSGDAFPLAEQLSAQITGAFTASNSGSIAYRPVLSLTSVSPHTQLVWLDPSGRQLGIPGPEGDYGNISLSPDAKYVTFERGNPSDVWVLDLEKGIFTRITSDPKSDGFPVWSTDGRTIAFATSRDGPFNIYRHAFGTVGADEPLIRARDLKEPSPFQSPVGWSRDGLYFVFIATSKAAVFDLWALRKGESSPERLTATPFAKSFFSISPDSHWMSYGSNETGRFEVYLESFPKTGTRQQVSTAGGIMPTWSTDGRTLFYLAPDSTMTSVTVKPAGETLEVGTPKRLFYTQIVGRGVYVPGQSHNYAVASDGRFLVKFAPVDTASTPITVIANWAAGLKK